MSAGNRLHRERRRYSALATLSVLLLICACSHSKAAPKPDSAAGLLAIPAADNSKYPDLEKGRHWSNPYLIIRPEKIGLLTDLAPNEERLLKPQEVLSTLGQLPPQAWPYGRAVAILMDQKRANSEQQKAALLRNRGIVEGDLDRAHVAIRWISNS